IRFIVISIKGISTAKFKKCHNLYSIALGKGKEAIKILRKNSIKNIIFLGGLKKPNLIDLKPDLWSFFKIFNVLFFNRTDNTVLSRVIGIFEREGFIVIGLKDISNNFFLKSGIYGKKYTNFYKFGDKGIIDNMLRTVLHWTKGDIGQAAITSRDDIIRYEDSSGTDNLIKKIISSKKDRENSYLFIKVKKSLQDDRIDLPTFGMSTIKYLVKTNIKHIVLEADYTVILDKKKILKSLKKDNIRLVSIDRDHISSLGDRV
ncbi:MAG: hypothetical protein CFH23_00337, partial [Alphaproteobacteria bacterium MarineAlpha6_Bin1]